MKKYLYFLIAILIVTLFGQCVDSINNSNSNNNSSGSKDLNSTSSIKNVVKTKPLNQYTPSSFLNSLIESDGYNKIGNFPKDWVKKSDIDTLISLLNSNKKCNCYVNLISSHSTFNESAEVVGFAIIFINSYRNKTDIDLGGYSCPKANKDSIEHILKWWQNSKL